MDFGWFAIYIVILFMLLVGSIKIGRRLPYSIVFIVAFCVFPLLSTMGLGGLYIPCNLTHICILISLFSYLIAYGFAKGKQYGALMVDCYSFTTRYKLLLFLNLLCFAVFLYMLPTVMSYMATHLLSDQREESTIEFLGNARMAALYSTIVKPIISISFVIIIDDIIRGEKIHKLTLFLTLTNMICDAVFFAGRALMVQCVFYVFFYIVFFRKEVKLSPQQKKLLIRVSAIIIAVLLCAIVFISMGRSGDDSAGVVKEHFVWYYVGPFLLFDYYVRTHNLLSINNDWFFGTCLFGPITNLGYMGLSALFPEIDYLGSDHVIATVTQYIRAPIGPGIYINAAVTAMYPFIKDFWLFGLIFGFGFYGFLTGRLEQLYKGYHSKRIRLITIVILYVVFKLEMRYELGPTLFIQILLIFLLIKKRKIADRTQMNS